MMQYRPRLASYLAISVFIFFSVSPSLSAESVGETSKMYSAAAAEISYGTESDQFAKAQTYSQRSQVLYENSDTSLSNYETAVPLLSKAKISRFEKGLLTRYLNNPNDVKLATRLGLYHLRHKHSPGRTMSGERLKHLVLAQYFLNRAIDLGSRSRRVEWLLKTSERQVNQLLESKSSVDLSETRDAHRFFIETFTENEGDRYLAYGKLLDDFVDNPNSIFSAFYINAVNLWIGGEVEADDPTILYHFIVGSYFSIYSMELTRRAEQAWMDDPENNIRFRLGSIIGGFSVLQRRWIAELHGDDEAKTILDEEHRQWYQKNPAFHSFTVGLPLFPEEENFLEGYMAWASAFSVCAERPELRTCPNRPRFTFNQLLMILGFVDYSLKVGDLDTAQLFLTFRYDPEQDFDDWDLGRDAWLHREQNFADIAELYANEDPADDPTFVVSRKHDWSAATSTCQICHQTQSRDWSQEEKNEILLPPDDILTIGEFPRVMTKWYGGLL